MLKSAEGQSEFHLWAVQEQYQQDSLLWQELYTYLLILMGINHYSTLVVNLQEVKIDPPTPNEEGINFTTSIWSVSF